MEILLEKIFENKEIKTKKHSSLLKGFLKEREKDKLTFICFGEKRIELTRDEVQSFLIRKFGEDAGRRVVIARVIIEEVIRKICINEYGFEPCLIKVDTFNVTAVEVSA